MTDQYEGQRALLVQAVRNATREPDDSGGYLPRLAREIVAGESAQVDTWIALDAIKLAQGGFDPAKWSGWTEHGEAWLAAGCPPLDDGKSGGNA